MAATHGNITLDPQWPTSRASSVVTRWQHAHRSVRSRWRRASSPSAATRCSTVSPCASTLPTATGTGQQARAGEAAVERNAKQDELTAARHLGRDMIADGRHGTDGRPVTALMMRWCTRPGNRICIRIHGMSRIAGTVSVSVSKGSHISQSQNTVGARCEHTILQSLGRGLVRHSCTGNDRMPASLPQH